jgi:hypothetical protein
MRFISASIASSFDKIESVQSVMLRREERRQLDLASSNNVSQWRVFPMRLWGYNRGVSPCAKSNQAQRQSHAQTGLVPVLRHRHSVSLNIPLHARRAGSYKG